MDPEVRDEGIEKETLKIKLRHKMTADMNKIRDHLKTIARIYNSAYQEAGVDVYLEPGILDFDTDTLEEHKKMTIYSCIILNLQKIATVREVNQRRRDYLKI